MTMTKTMTKTKKNFRFLSYISLINFYVMVIWCSGDLQAAQRPLQKNSFEQGHQENYRAESSSNGLNNLHPLQDLSQEEIKKVADVVKNSSLFGEKTFFVYITLQEPKKELVLSSAAAAPAAATAIPRTALALIYDRNKAQTWKVLVDVNQEKIIQQEMLAHVKPPLSTIDFEAAPDILNKDPGWIKAMQKRGVTNLEEVYLDVWAPGLLSDTEISQKKRLIRVIPFYKGPQKNLYARPMEGIVATVDLDKEEVVAIWDLANVPFASKGWDLDEESNGPLRAIKPLIPRQPQGPSFSVEGQEIKWQNWAFRYSMQPMQGLVLYDVRYNDGGQWRSVLYKAAVSEMIVPYAEPGQLWTFRSAFDVGEYGLGSNAHPMIPQQDLPENAVYFPAHFVDNQGEALQIDNAIGLYERDGGRLWKHYDTTSTITEGRRARDLVLTMMTTVGNYDYAFNWIFHLDGSMEVQVELTGIMLTKGTVLTKNPCDKECNNLVSPLIQAPNHQHFFNFRLDFDIDGQKNTPLEVNAKAVPMGKLNPAGNIYSMHQGVLSSEKLAMRSLSMPTSRLWKIVNSENKNSLGHPTGFALIPGENSVPFLHPNSMARQRAAFLNHHIWFTQFHDDEQNAAGDYPNQSEYHQGNQSKLGKPTSEGLSQWVRDNENLTQEDLVMWYTLGVTHHTRPEDWPAMPVHRAGFKVVPMNFFTHNPSMDVPLVR